MKHPQQVRGVARALVVALIAAVSGVGACSGGGAGKADGAAPADGSGTGDDQWAACTWQGTTSMATPDSGVSGNNVADLSGAPLGSVIPDLSVQRKTVMVQAEQLANEVTVGTGYLWRPTATSESAYLVVAIANVTDHVVCSVKGTSYRWLDADGNATFTGDTIYIDGTVAALSSTGDFTDSCLGPGEKGYFTDVQAPADATAVYTKTTTVAFGLAGPFSAGAAPAGRLVAQSYDVGTCPTAAGTGPAVKVTLANTGSGDVALEPYSLSPAILMDSGGAPVSWLYLQAPASVTVAAGQTTTVYSSLFMEPSVQRMQIYVDFTTP